MRELEELKIFYLKEFSTVDFIETTKSSASREKTPSCVYEFFSDFAIRSCSLRAFGDEIVVPDLNTLEKAQWGYSYNPKLKKKTTSWPENWYVVAYQGAMPFILDLETLKVGIASPGKNQWASEFYFSGLQQFFWSVGITTSILLKCKDIFCEQIDKDDIALARDALERLYSKEEVESCLRGLSWE